MPEEKKAGLAPVGVGCFVTILSAICGAALGYTLMPAIPDGGYYGAITDALWSLILYCGYGLVMGLLVGAFLAGRVTGWLERHKDS